MAQSRSTQEGTFDAGDAIGIFAYEPKSQQMYYQNSKYVFDGKVFVPATDADNIRVSSGTDYDFMYTIRTILLIQRQHQFRM